MPRLPAVEDRHTMAAILQRRGERLRYRGSGKEKVS